ncbi:hypothetical protein NIES22_66060 [Calothrix brevissima NIES-22]|nr:hypothetical protein NIES22_66060 [Calothrix brevissima NIES-22]
MFVRLLYKLAIIQQPFLNLLSWECGISASVFTRVQVAIAIPNIFTVAQLATALTDDW